MCSTTLFQMKKCDSAHFYEGICYKMKKAKVISYNLGYGFVASALCLYGPCLQHSNVILFYFEAV